MSLSPLGLVNLKALCGEQGVPSEVNYPQKLSIVAEAPSVSSAMIIPSLVFRAV